MRTHRVPWLLAGLLLVVLVVFMGVGGSRAAYQRGFVDGQLRATEGDALIPDGWPMAPYAVPLHSYGMRPRGVSLGWILLVLGLVIVATRGLRWPRWSRWAHEAGPEDSRREWRRHVREMHRKRHPWFCGEESDRPSDRGTRSKAETSQEA